MKKGGTKRAPSARKPDHRFSLLTIITLAIFVYSIVAIDNNMVAENTERVLRAIVWPLMALGMGFGVGMGVTERNKAMQILGWGIAGFFFFFTVMMLTAMIVTLVK